MRISYWSSDVCSSDLGQCGHGHVGKIGDHARRTLTHRNQTNAAQRHNVIVLRSFVTEAKSGNYRWQIGQFTDPAILQKPSGKGDARRSEVRRVGKEGVATCRSR